MCILHSTLGRSYLKSVFSQRARCLSPTLHGCHICLPWSSVEVAFFVYIKALCIAVICSAVYCIEWLTKPQIQNVISQASYPWQFPCGTNETASFIIHEYNIYLTKWPTVHNAAQRSNVTGDNRRWVYCKTQM